MAETHDPILNEAINEKLVMEKKNQAKKKTEHKTLSWKSSLDIFSSCKDYQSSSETKKSKTKKEKKKNEIKNGAIIEEDNNRAVSASSSFNSVTTTSSTFSSLSSLSSSFSSLSGSFRATMQIRKLSGCSEISCNAVVGPVNWVSSPSLRASLSPCEHCGEIFSKPESLEFHHATRHAVAEIGLEDTSRKIVEIIFQSSWIKKKSSICKIERILKVQNTKITISKFEQYRETIKLKSLDQAIKRSNPRCVADGNELLRFYPSTLSCKLGFDGTTNLCQSINKCEICGIIKDGLQVDSHGKICTFGTSTGADEMAVMPRVIEGEKKAMLVSRVISGRIGTCDGSGEEDDEFDSMISKERNLDELVVFNSKAILPCFLVVYSVY